MNVLDQALSHLRTQLPSLALRAVVALVAFAACVLLARLAAGWVERLLTRRADATLGSVASSAVHAFGVGLGIVIAVERMGLDVTTILAGAGVLGLAVGFGAQTLVKDTISGFFLIMDGVLKNGDFARVGSVTGTVEAVGLRRTTVRAFDGQLFYIPNGSIDLVGNFSRDWVRAVVEVGLAYEQEVAKGMEVLARVGAEYAEERPDLVLEPPEVQGLTNFMESEVRVRLVAKVKPPEHLAVERDLRKRIKAAFDAEGVEIPFARRVVIERRPAAS